MADEVLGSASVTIELDESRVDGDLNRLADRIERTLEQAARDAGKRMERALKAATRSISPLKVTVDADTSPFDAAMASLESATRSVTVDVRPRVDIGRAESSIDELGDRIERELDQSSAAGAARMVRNLKAAAKAASPIEVRVTANIRPARAQIEALRGFETIQLKLEPDIDLAAFQAAAERAAAKLKVKVRVVPDFTEFDAQVRAHVPPPITVRVNADINDSRLSRALGSIGKTAGKLGGFASKFAALSLAIGGVGVAAFGAVQGVFALSAALAPAAGIVAALPAAALGAVAAFGALKLALSGVGDAFKAGLTGDAQAFEKAIQGLSPAAKSVAKEVRALKPAFGELKKSVQDAFFSKITGEITKTAQALGGPLKSGLTGISAAWGTAASQALGYIRGSQGVANITSILGASQKAVEGLSLSTNKLTAGFLKVAGTVSDAFGARFGSAIASAGERFGQFLQRAADSGAAVRAVEGAIQVFGQLGEIAGNVGGIIKNVFASANDVGGGLLNNLARITGEFEKFTASAQGSQAISNIFTAISTGASQLGPILAAIVTQLGGIAVGLAPILETVGGALVEAVNALGPAIQAVLPGLQTFFTAFAQGISEISKSGALTALGVAFGQILTAVSPLLPVIGQLAGLVGNILAGALGTLATFLSPVITALAGALAPVIPIISEAFGNLFEAVKPIAATFGVALAGAITVLAPLLKTVATAFKDITKALIPVGTAIAGAILPALPSLLEGFKGMVDAVIPLVPKIAELAVKLAEFAAKAIESAGPALKFGAELIKWVNLEVVVPIIEKIVDVISGIIDGVTYVIDSVMNFRENFLGTWRLLKESVEAIILAFVNNMQNFFTNLWTDISTTVSTGIDNVINFFTTLPDKIITTLSGLKDQVITFFTDIWTTMTENASLAFDGLVAFFTGLPERIAAALGTLAGTIAKFFLDLGVQIREQGSALIETVVTFFSELPGKVSTFFVQLYNDTANWFSQMYTAATTKASELINQVSTFFSELPGRVSAWLSQMYNDVVNWFSQSYNSATSKASELISQVSNFFSSLPGRVSSYLSQMYNNVVSQFNNAKNQAISTTQSMINNVVNYISALPGRARSALSGIGSSLQQAGRDLIQGFINGMNSAAGAIVDRARSIAASATNAFKSALGIHSPSRVFHELGEDTAQGYVNGLRASNALVGKSADQMAKTVQTVFKARLDTIADTIKSATSYAASEAKKASEGVTLPGLFAGGDQTAAGLQAGLDAQIKQIRDFDREMNDLRRRGLTGDLLSQVIGLGPEKGLALAKTLNAASSDQLRALVATNEKLKSVSEDFGRDAADNLFDAGKNAAFGFLEGLKSEQSEITRLMETIAKGSASAIRKALGIHSPSRVFASIGKQTMAGLALGIDGNARLAVDASQRVAYGIANPFGGASPSFASESVRGAQSASAERSGRTVNNSRTANNSVTVNVNGSADAKATADVVIRRITAQLGV